MDRPSSASSESPISPTPVAGSRRQFFREFGGALAAGLALSQGWLSTSAHANPTAPSSSGSHPFTLADLPYPADALEAVIDAKTMEIHHGRHHKAYVDTVNKALEGKSGLASQGLEELLTNIREVPEAIRTIVRNHGGGHHNHTLFWDIMTPGGSPEPTGDLAQAISRDFGSFDTFKTQFVTTGLGVFGSGWAFLVRDGDGKLSIQGLPNQDSPLMEGFTPILGNDVWEHAYYLRYQNRRRDYLEAWWQIVNWNQVASLYEGRKLSF